MPIILITGAEMHFIMAEAWFRGIGVPMDKDQADIEYMNGINSSVELPLSEPPPKRDRLSPRGEGEGADCLAFPPWGKRERGYLRKK